MSAEPLRQAIAQRVAGPFHCEEFLAKQDAKLSMRGYK